MSYPYQFRLKIIKLVTEQHSQRAKQGIQNHGFLPE